MKNRNRIINTRVTSSEKAQIVRRAQKCGLSVSEYLRQRGMGYAPREESPEVYYSLCRKLDSVKNDSNSAVILDIMDDLRKILVEPGEDS